MKLSLSIMLNILLLFVFTTAPNIPMWACEKSKSKNAEQHTKSSCQKACCKKGTSKKTCCQRHSTDSKNDKKGCCGEDECQCSVSITVLVDLPKQLLIIFSIQPVTIQQNIFSYKQVILSSTIQDIWQPPIIALS